MIKPSSYELEGLLGVIHHLKQRELGDYFLEGLWRYLLYTEVAISAVREAEARPAGIAIGSAMDQLRAEMVSIGIQADEDFAVRLENVVKQLHDDLAELPSSTGDARSFINERLNAGVLADLRRTLGLAVQDRERVAVLIDNLDKAWERGTDYPLLARLILGLLTAVGKVEREFRREDSWRRGVNLSLTVFLRADIYNVVAQHAREPDKISTLSIEWKDPELLARVIEDRYAAAHESLPGANVWTELFDAEVQGVPTRDYLLWRVLPRPRDLVYLGNAALTAAVNRRHEQVTSDDIIFAEKGYSLFALDALLVESYATDIDLENSLYEFAGLDSTLDETQVVQLLNGVGGGLVTRDWLVRAGFLGLEVSDEHFEYVQDAAAERRARVLGRRLAERNGRPSRLRVHPAFRPYLEIRDDDLH